MQKYITTLSFLVLFFLFGSSIVLAQTIEQVDANVVGPFKVLKLATLNGALVFLGTDEVTKEYCLWTNKGGVSEKIAVLPGMAIDPSKIVEVNGKGYFHYGKF